MKTFAQLNKKLCPFEVGPSFSQNLTFFADLLLRSAKIKQIFEIFISVFENLYKELFVCKISALYPLSIKSWPGGGGGNFYPTLFIKRTWKSPFRIGLTHWSYCKCKDILHTLNLWKISAKEPQVIDGRDANEISVSLILFSTYLDYVPQILRSYKKLNKVKIVRFKFSSFLSALNTS